MGTSNSNRGQKGRTPLVPSWLVGAGGAPPAGPQPPTPAQTTPRPVPSMPVPPAFPAIPALGAASRFTSARNNFSRFASSGGRDRASLGRALSQYVSTSIGGNATATERMGSSRTSGAQLAGFLSNAVNNGPREALRALKLENLAGRPIEEIFIGLIDYVCPEGGSLDEGIAREAFIETIADLANSGVVDFDTLNADQMQTIFELYATHAIETRLCNDIGVNSITLPADATAAASLQRQLLDFVRRSVADAMTKAREAMLALTPERVFGFVTSVYQEAWRLLQAFGEAEAEAEAT
jgi:hypothetical protein